jgi:PAS domain S-box-containing protein
MKNTLLKRFLSLSLRTHLLLLALLISLPEVGLIIHSAQHHRNDSINKGIEETRRLAYGIASEQNNLVAAAHQLVTVLARLPQVRAHSASDVNEILASVLKLNPQYGNIVITDRKGDVWASALPKTTNFSLSDKRTFLNALKTRRFSSGEYVVGKISAKQTIGFGYPIIDEKGEVEGVIAVNINFDHLNELLQQSGMPAGTTFSILDHGGVIIDRNLDPAKFIGRMASEDILLKILNGPDEESFIDSGIPGQKQIVSYRKLRLEGEQFPYLCVHVSIPLKATLANARHEQLINMAVLSPLLLISLAIAVLIGRFCFTNRIKKIQEAAKSFARGNLNIRISEEVEGGEFGSLSRSLDEMAHQLSEREQALRKSEQDYRILADNSADIIWRLGEDYRILYINPADERLRGFEKSEVLGQPLTNILSPEDVANVLERGSNRLAREMEGIQTGPIRFETSLICKSGGMLRAEVQSTPIRDEEGKIVGYHGVARDVTERKIAEEVREKLIMELQDALASISALNDMIPLCTSCKKDS